MQIDSTTYRATNTTPRTEAIDLAVVHSTEGPMPGCAEWLTNPATKVSTDYIIARSGTIYQLAPASVFTWHAGVSALPGSPERARYNAQRLVKQDIDPVPSVNGRSLGIELEHIKGGQPYTAAQKQALTELLTSLLGQHPGMQILRHADVALPDGRKKDPTDWPADGFRAFVASLTPPPAPSRYSEDSPILGISPLTAGQVSAALALQFPERSDNPAQYTQFDVRTMVASYWQVSERVGVNALLALSQSLHETADWTSFWSLRPQRNPAGIGVTGAFSLTQPPNPEGWHYNYQRKRWEIGLSFKNWNQHSIPAQIGRLLAYALPAGSETDAQRELIARALSYRPLPAKVRGTAPLLRLLGKANNPSGEGWASPGDDYGAKIAQRANRLVAETL